MTYPTRHDLVHRPQLVQHRNALQCLTVMAELRDVARRPDLHPSIRQQAKTDFVTALRNAQRYATIARCLGWHIPG